MKVSAVSVGDKVAGSANTCGACGLYSELKKLLNFS